MGVTCRVGCEVTVSMYMMSFPSKNLSLVSGNKKLKGVMVDAGVD